MHITSLLALSLCFIIQCLLTFAFKTISPKVKELPLIINVIKNKIRRVSPFLDNWSPHNTAWLCCFTSTLSNLAHTVIDIDLAVQGRTKRHNSLKPGTHFAFFAVQACAVYIIPLTAQHSCLKFMKLRHTQKWRHLWSNWLLNKVKKVVMVTRF